jgi:sugar lactone lactonase YvrE
MQDQKGEIMSKIKRASLFTLIALLLFLLPVSAKADPFPNLIQLPIGFRPEGIAVGRGSTFYVGSLVDGAILRGDLRTGQSSNFVPGQAGMITVGLGFDQRNNRLFAAGGGTGLGRVFDARTGALLQTYSLAAPGNFINDVIVTREAAFFTNSSQALLYRVPFGKNGSLPAPSAVEALPLSGGWVQVPGFNANGIEATPNGKNLVVVNSTSGKLYRVDPRSGTAAEIDLGGQSVSAGDGLLFRDELLYVMRNRLNEIVVIDLSKDLTSGKVVDRLTHPNFNVPTTLAAFGDALYAVNAKFGAPSPNMIPYEIVRVPLDD